jgi:hypothetical protein
VQRWNLPDGWVISRKPAHEALVSEADFIAAQDNTAARGPARGGDPAGPGRRRYLLAGLLVCGACGRRMKSAWYNGKATYRCRHGHTSAARPDPGRAKNAYIRERSGYGAAGRRCQSVSRNGHGLCMRVVMGCRVAGVASSSL